MSVMRRRWSRKSGVALSSVFISSVVACSSTDDSASPPPQQLGNGTAFGGQPGMFSNGGSQGVIGNGGRPGAQIGMVGAGGIITTGGVTGAGGINGMGGILGTSGVQGVGGIVGGGGVQGAGGIATGGEPSTGGSPGMGGASTGGEPTSGTGGISSGGDPETGRLAGITAAHNAVRAAVTDTATPLPPLTWSPTIAAYAQEWADSLAANSCGSPHHRSSADLQQKGYGENLAAFSSTFGSSTAADAVNGWAAEKACWTFGTFARTDQCDATCYARLNSDGCGHYTQIVWRSSTEVGCGVATCKNGNFSTDIWICNYAPAGNFVGQNPY